MVISSSSHTFFGGEMDLGTQDSRSEIAEIGKKNRRNFRG
jgi:hypothetical protein